MLSDQLLALVDGQLGELEQRVMPGYELPRLLFGHPVGADVRADLAFTLGKLARAGRDLEQPLRTVLSRVDGARTNTFYSYRVAETLLDAGCVPLDSFEADVQRELVRAVDSTDWLPALDDGKLPRNYAAVLARCEHARVRLGLTDATLRDHLLERVADMLRDGYLDDSWDASGRYDMYTVDVYLFCRPLAPLLGDVWSAGMEQVFGLVERVASRTGEAMTWGRSVGALALCHLLEVCGVAVDLDRPDADRWAARAATAIPFAHRWFDAGFVTSHRHRDADPYRGLDRRLQMTLDCLGKLVDAAVDLDGATAPQGAELLPARDELVPLSPDGRAAVWSFRSDATAFVVPFVGGSTTDYLPTPRAPGLFEGPVGSALATGVPVVLRKGRRFAPGGKPSSIEHVGPGTVRATYDGLVEVGRLEGGERIDGACRVTWRVDGRTVTGTLELDLADQPHGIALQVTDAERRPQRVRFDASAPHTSITLDVDGLKDLRSCWGELARVHQVDVEPTRQVRITCEMRPSLRVISTEAGHHYDASLWGPLVADQRVVESRFRRSQRRPGQLAGHDVLHVHWPEWLFGPDLDAHRALIDEAKREGVAILLTQHNLVPHSKDERIGPIYEAWTAAADVVLHHTRWGERLASERYRYRDDVRSIVIPHGAWLPSTPLPDRRDAEDALGLRHDVLRLGIVGAPRAEKDVQLAMRAVAASTRQDVELVVWSLRPEETAPDDPRVIASPYDMVDRAEYDRRLAVLDALVMPFDPGGEMLATGTVGDAIGFGIPVLSSSWPFLVEVLGEAAVVYGETEADLAAAVDGLDGAALAHAGAAARALQPRHDWAAVAEQVWAAVEDLGPPE